MEKDKKFFHGHTRLAEERAKLWPTQQQAADFFGVSRVTWGQCERGNATPSGDVLAGLAAAGADVLYILTGQRSHPVREPLLRENTMGGMRREGLIPGQGVGDMKTDGTWPGYALTSDERAWLETYRNSSPEVRLALKAASDALAKSSKRKQAA